MHTARAPATRTAADAAAPFWPSASTAGQARTLPLRGILAGGGDNSLQVVTSMMGEHGSGAGHPMESPQSDLDVDAGLLGEIYAYRVQTPSPMHVSSLGQEAGVSGSG